MKKKFFFSLTIILSFLLLGFFLSVNTGISHDESHEQYNWINNLEAYKSIFGFGDYNKLLDYGDKYHGVSFQLISQPIQYLIYNLVSLITESTLYASYLLSKHFVVFSIFLFSAFYFNRICFFISRSKAFSRYSTLLYFFYPYFLGHSLINPKDTPFLVFWLITTYYFLKILKQIYFDQIISLKNILKLSFFSAFLISIRISGFLIIIEFIVGLLVLLSIKENFFLTFLKKNIKNLIYFLIIFLITLFALNPIFWNGPIEIFNSLKYMSKYFNNVCTLTLGKCERSLDLSPNYYFIWLFFKLPIICLCGIIMFPFVEKKIIVKNFTLLIFLTLVISSLSIISLFILQKVAIYDEIRHIMFIIPLILIPSFYNIYLFSKKIFLFFVFSSLILFTLDNFKLYPYQYTWLNEFSKFYVIDKNFEIDYWGTSNKALQKKIIEMEINKKISNEICVFGDGYTNAYLEKKGFSCFGTYNQIDALNKRPFVAYQNLRNLKRNDPYNCNLVHEENYRYFFSKQAVTTGKVWYCY